MVNKVILLNKEFRLGIGFLNRLIDGVGKDLNTIGQEVINNRAVMVPQMMYYSLLYAYERASKTIDFTIDDIYDWIDENGGIDKGEFWNDFLIAFGKSMNQDVPALLEADKKKATKK